jgi:putative FmdB family regulatory protein
MPMYTYYCDECDATLERIRTIQDRDTAVCENCGHWLDRQIDKPGMVWSPTRSGGNHS